MKLHESLDDILRAIVPVAILAGCWFLAMLALALFVRFTVLPFQIIFG
jgi:hypothetical protein